MTSVAAFFLDKNFLRTHHARMREFTDIPAIVFIVQGTRLRGLRVVHWYGNSVHISRDDAQAEIDRRTPRAGVSFAIIEFKK